MRNHMCCTLLLSAVLVSGCSCPPVGGGRSSGSDPAGGTFAFLGGLRCFFGGDDSKDTKDKDETRPVTTADLADKPKAQESAESDHAAALTIR